MSHQGWRPGHQSDSGRHLHHLRQRLEPPAGPAGPGQVPQDRPDQARHDLQARHGQHHRPEDRGASSRQEEAGEDDYPQVSLDIRNVEVKTL